MEKKSGIRRIIGSSGQAEHMLILNVNDPKVIPSINLDIFYVWFNLNTHKFIGITKFQRVEGLSIGKWLKSNYCYFK